MLDATSLLLFGKFPRDIGFPYRQQVGTAKEMDRYASYNNGITDVFIAVYPSNYVIDKIFFDLDYGPDVLGDAKKLYTWCLDNKYDAIPIVSGKKGYHIYLLTKPKIYGPEAKIALTRASYSVIKSVFGSFKQEIYVDSKGKQNQILRTEKRIIAPDPMVIGDIRRFGRLPNTLRPPENLNYCTFLPPDEFLDMTETDITRHMKEPHTYDYEVNLNESPLLTDFEYDFEDVPDFKDWVPMSTSSTVVTSNPCGFLKEILRPCLYRHIVSIHPCHMIRTAVAIDLLEYDYSPEEITDVFSTLGWEDFNEKITLEQVRSCTKYKPYSCTKLRNNGIPNVCCVS